VAVGLRQAAAISMTIFLSRTGLFGGRIYRSPICQPSKVLSSGKRPVVALLVEG
jgi:hypothetical protein